MGEGAPGSDDEPLLTEAEQEELRRVQIGHDLAQLLAKQREQQEDD